jgi:hypothetical protein
MGSKGLSAGKAVYLSIRSPLIVVAYLVVVDVEIVKALRG